MKEKETVQDGGVVVVDRSVVLLLHRRQLHVDHRLLLRLQRLLHVLLHASQQEWLQFRVQLLQLTRILHVAEVSLERLHVVELLRLQKVQQRPQLLGVVL